MQKRISTLIGILIIIAAAVVLVGGAWAYFWYANSNPPAGGPMTNSQSNPNVQNLNTQTISTTNLSDDTIIDAIDTLSGFQFKKDAQTGTYTYNPEGGNYSIDMIAKGNLNGDGFEDAIVQGTHCGASCGSDFTIVINKNNSANAFYVYPDGIISGGASQYGFKSITINNGIITIDAQTWQPDKSSTQVFTYKLIGNNLVRIN